MNYYKKIKKFNTRNDYAKDIEVARLLLINCLSISKHKKIFFIGTGLGGDLKIVKNLKNINIVGIEPQILLQDGAEKNYKQIKGTLLKMNPDEFIKTSKNQSGIFLFIHSINHIPTKQLLLFQKSIKDSYIIVINPNPQIKLITGKTDETVISYLDSNNIKKLLNCKIMFDFFYNLKNIKKNMIFLRESLLLKTKD